MKGESIMGKQVRFYMMPEDELSFLQFACQEQDVVLLARSSTGPKLQILEVTLDVPQKRSKLSVVLLWNKAFPFREDDVQELRAREYKEELGTYVETDNVFYSVDKLNAPVIEFSPSFIRADEELVQGRIWAEMYRSARDSTVYKGKDFESWYIGIAKWIRSRFERVKGVDAYLGPEAIKWFQRGGKLGK
jgi:hypothetical protein